MIRRMLACVAVMGVAAVAMTAPLAAQGQDDWDRARLHMTREGLEELLARYEQATRSAAYSENLRARARYEASLIRARLEEGDFQVGDEIVLTVEGEQQLTNTFKVGPNRILVLPIVGEIPMRGVLRSELEDHVRKHVARMIHDPVVRARASLRIFIMGEVAAPGYYMLSSETQLTEALMAAGGPTREAKLQDIRIQRGSERIWGGQPLQEAIIEGRTLDQLSLRAGDQIVVPREQIGRNFWDILRFGALTIPPLIYALSRIF